METFKSRYPGLAVRDPADRHLTASCQFLRVPTTKYCAGITAWVLLPSDSEKGERTWAVLLK